MKSTLREEINAPRGIVRFPEHSGGALGQSGLRPTNQNVRALVVIRHHQRIYGSILGLRMLP